MPKDTFRFFLYRLNKEIRKDLFSWKTDKQNQNDSKIKDFLKEVSHKKYDIKNETKKSIYTWSLRNYFDLTNDFSSIVLAKSQHQKKATIVTDTTLIEGDSISTPPPADTIILLFYWPRHVVVVENRSGMTTGETWLRNFHKIIDNAKLNIDIGIVPRLEPIPYKGSILNYFRDLERIFKFRIKLKLPNPELNRWSQKIYDEMIEEKLTEYLQEFYSPNGIRKDENSKSFSSGALAELGYKDGPVHITGEKNGEIVQVDEGKTAIRGSLEGLKSFVQGLLINADGKKLPRALRAIEEEIDKLIPNEE